MSNPLLEVQRFGQSVWYDNIRRGLITSGELRAMVEQDGLLGVTSNPAIFEKAIAGSPDYDAAFQALMRQGVSSAKELYERLAIEDIQLAADVLHPVYLRSQGRDGFVSLEVSPYLAHDTQGTIDEALRLHAALDRPNVMIKVPATPAGIPAIARLIGEGLSINVTLLFSVEAYEAAARAYLEGLDTLLARGRDPSRVASVASFFISRIDSFVDERLARALDATRDPARRALVKGIVGRVAIANARDAYAHFRELLATPRWKALAARGARPQRVLWASTGTKNPRYPKTIYVDELIGPDTVNTLPAETFTEFRARGRPRPSLMENQAESLQEARETLEALAPAGFSLREVTDHLLHDGVQKFSDAFDKLLAAVEKKRQAFLGSDLARQSATLGEAETAAVAASLEDWRREGKVRRLWARDPGIWSSADEDRWLGWLDVVDGSREHWPEVERVVEDVRSAGVNQILLLGMGGSSLCPEVMRRTFGVLPGHPELLVLDSTVPAQVRHVAGRIDPAKTLFIVSSKSGSTTEPNVFKQYFFAEAQRSLGADAAGSRFVAITDAGTKMHKTAKADRFRHILFGVASIGGRYSALSNFGMAPAALMGVDVPEFLERADVMVQACASCVPPEVNPGVQLGAILGTLARQGRDKLTLVASPGVAALGAWLEQLVAESTGKLGKGLVPVDDERLGPPEVYGSDRVFVYVRLEPAFSAEQDDAVAALEAAGQPVVRIALDDAMDLGQEFFRWEIATAVAGAILGLNPFDQPDVEASKIATRRLTEAYERTGELPQDKPFFEGDGIRLFADARNADAITGAARRRDAAALLAAHLGRLRPGDYLALNAYLEMSPGIHRELQALRHRVRDRKRVATTLGYGPRFLHSTGQLHKGGPDTGVFLQITAEDAEDLAIPGQRYGFAVLERAQALGDFAVLAERGRRALRLHLGPDVESGLARLQQLVEDAMV